MYGYEHLNSIEYLKDCRRIMILMPKKRTKSSIICFVVNVVITIVYSVRNFCSRNFLEVHTIFFVEILNFVY